MFSQKGVVLCGLILGLVVGQSCWAIETMPLPEHPRPDFQRSQWSNLNGTWQFQFDKDNKGLSEGWASKPLSDVQDITVPFPWGSKLSGVKDEANVGWYQRKIQVPQEWDGQRVFLVIGASDWHTTVWLDGKKLGDHKGGYTPFDFDLTPYLKPGDKQTLTIRVDDTPHKFKLEGKQGYGRAAGIWQTVYLEARPKVAMEFVHFTPDIDKKKVNIRVMLDKVVNAKCEFQLTFKPGHRANPVVSHVIPKGKKEISFDVAIPNTHLAFTALSSITRTFTFFLSISGVKCTNSIATLGLASR